jgi:hypothetical protein
MEIVDNLSRVLICFFAIYGPTMTIAHILREEAEEHYSCCCYIVIDGRGFDAKIMHKGRGKFKILNDEYGGKYSNKIVDASDVVRCKTEI